MRACGDVTLRLEIFFRESRTPQGFVLGDSLASKRRWTIALQQAVGKMELSTLGEKPIRGNFIETFKLVTGYVCYAKFVFKLSYLIKNPYIARKKKINIYSNKISWKFKV